jgi:hypothetical protein
MTQAHMRQRPAPTSAPAGGSTRLLGVGFIWAASALIAIAAPDMVSGSQHEHLPLAAVTIWLWAAVGSGYAAMTPVRDARDWLLGVGTVWAAAAATAVLAPVMETGSDPTRIPIAALVAPPVAAVVTGFLALAEARRQN